MENKISLEEFLASCLDCNSPHWQHFVNTADGILKDRGLPRKQYSGSELLQSAAHEVIRKASEGKKVLKDGTIEEFRKWFNNFLRNKSKERYRGATRKKRDFRKDNSTNEMELELEVKQSDLETMIEEFHDRVVEESLDKDQEMRLLRVFSQMLVTQNVNKICEALGLTREEVKNAMSIVRRIIKIVSDGYSSSSTD